MQEEVEQRIVSLMISCGKLGEQEFRKAVAKLLEQLKSDHQKHQYSKANPHGKMTVKQLAAKDKGLQSIEVTDQNIGSFNRIARKYGIDFAPFKVKGEKRYMVFFKAPDADAMTAAFKEYTAKQVRKAERPSVLEKLQHFKSLIQAAVVDRTKPVSYTQLPVCSRTKPCSCSSRPPPSCLAPMAKNRVPVLSTPNIRYNRSCKRRWLSSRAR